MTRADAIFWLALLVTAPVVATHAADAQKNDALDPEFLEFLADETTGTAGNSQDKTQDPELIAWLQDWWNPADTADASSEKTP